MSNYDGRRVTSKRRVVSQPQSEFAMLMTALEQEFDDACVKSVEECRKLGYNPSLFVKMRAELGSRDACRRLMNTPTWPDGFTRLWEMGRLDLSIEAFVHDNPKFKPLFDQNTLAKCEKRLMDAEYVKAS